MEVEVMSIVHGVGEALKYVLSLPFKAWKVAFGVIWDG
jgi:hypothetical protein